MLEFGFGLFVGTFAGVLLTCMCVVSRDAEAPRQEGVL